MARARNIKPGLFKNELLGVADPMLTILFQSLWCLADKAGRLEDRPLRIKAETFPYREGLDVNGYLTELERMGFIYRYSVNGLRLIQVVNFYKHQNPHKTEKESELPDFSMKTDSCDLTVKERLNNGTSRADSLIPDSLNIDSGLRIADKKSTARGSRLPADWHPSEQEIEFCQTERPDLDCKSVADQFRDYWHGVAGTKGCKLDWSATWRNWVRGQKQGRIKPTGNGAMSAVGQRTWENGQAWLESGNG